MKPKVLPGQTGATLDLLWISGFHPATCMWDLGEMWVEVVGVGTALCHTQCLASGRLPGEAVTYIIKRVLVQQRHPATATLSRGCYSTRALLCPHHTLAFLSCTTGADEEMTDVLQDLGLRSVSMGLVVLRRCWGNLSFPNHCLCHGSCSLAQEASGDTRQLPAAWRGAGSCLG